MGQGGKFLLQIITLAIIARILEPSDFGLYALGMIACNFGQAFVDNGLSSSILQKPELTGDDIVTCFFMAFVLGMAGCFVVSVLGFPAAKFFNDERLELVFLVSGVIFFISALSSIPRAVVRRRLLHQLYAKRDLVSFALSTGVSIIAAAAGWSYFALFLQPLTYSLVLLVVFSGFIRPESRGSLSNSSVRALLPCGAWVGGFGFLNFVSKYTDAVLVGRLFGIDAAGVYDRAYRIFTLPIAQLGAPLSQVVIPEMSSCLGSNSAWRRKYICHLLLYVYPVSAFSAFSVIYSKEIVGVMLGGGWEKAASIFSILVLSSPFQAICNSCGWIYISSGRGRDMFYWGASASAFIIVLLVIGSFWGLHGVAWAYSISLMVLSGPCMYFAYRGTSLTAFSVAFVLMRPFLVCGLAAATTVTVGLLLFGTPKYHWLAALCFYALFCISYCFIFSACRKDFNLIVSALTERSRA